MTQIYDWVDDDGTTRLRAYPSPEIVGGFSDWTQDATTKAVVVTLPDPDVVPLSFTPPTGATADATDQVEVNDDTGQTRFRVDAAGGARHFVKSGSAFQVAGDTGAAVIEVDGDGTLGFYNANPVAQPTVTNATAADILAALVTLGLVIDGT